MADVTGTKALSTPMMSSSASTAPHKKTDSPRRIAEAAKQFEALLIAQLLKTVRDGGAGGWLGTGEDQAGAQTMEIAEEQFARSLAEQGGLGLARLVVTGLVLLCYKRTI